jgi:hypothetical protein
MFRHYFSDRSHRIDAIVLVSLISSVFVFESYLAMIWSSYGVLSQYDVIFDTDPIHWQSTFANGWSTGGFNHPLLTYYFSIPLRALSAITSALGLTSDSLLFREQIALFIAPLCTALKASCLFVVFRILGLNVVASIAATGFGVLSFSAIVFGAIPSSYAITGFALSLILLLTVHSTVRASRVGFVSMFIAGVFSAGITSSNIIQFGFMNWSSLSIRAGKPLPALAKAIVLSAMVLVVALSSSYLIGKFRSSDDISYYFVVSDSYVERFKPTVSEQVENVLRFPERAARTFIPTTPNQKDNAVSIKQNRRVKIEFTYNTTEFGWSSFVLWLIGLGVFAGGTLIAYRMGGAWRWLGLGSAATALTFGALYSWFGLNTYLFSQTWQVPCLLLLAAWFNLPFFRSKLGHAFVAICLLALFVGDLYVLDSMNQSMSFG